MAVPLSTPGRCCGHNRNHHSTPKFSCLICDCRKFDPDPCYHGHEAGCEHMVDPAKRCRATFRRNDWTASVRCVEEHSTGNRLNQIHRARHPVQANVFVTFYDQEAVYPQPVEEGSNAGASASQVGGNHYTDLKIQPWDIWEALDLDAFTGAILKYLLRRKGSRVEDLRKARHTLDKLIEIEEKRDGVLREEAEEAR